MELKAKEWASLGPDAHTALRTLGIDDDEAWASQLVPTFSALGKPWVGLTDEEKEAAGTLYDLAVAADPGAVVVGSAGDEDARKQAWYAPFISLLALRKHLSYMRNDCKKVPACISVISRLHWSVPCVWVCAGGTARCQLPGYD
eukprot:COSAG05_NODE_147_length_16383_cov_266.102555_17_plen_144_part_00